MNAGGETADQMVRMTLQGIEVAANITLKAGGSAAKSLAATLYSIITDNKKIKGKTRLNTMLKSGKELKVFAIRHDDLKLFCDEAKRYGVLYSVLKEKNNTNGICDIMVRAEDAAKISRIVDKLELATIDTKAIKEAIIAQQQLKDIETLNDQQHDELVTKLMDEQQNPQKARTKNEQVFEHSLTTQSQAQATSPKEKRPSVKKELEEIKKKQQNISKSKTKQREIKHQHITKKKKRGDR